MARTLKTLLAMSVAAVALFGSAGLSAAQTDDDCYPIPDDGCDVGSDDDGVDDGADDGVDGVDDGVDSTDDGVDDGVGGADDGVDDGVGGADDGVDDGVGGADDGVDDGVGGADDGADGRTDVLGEVDAEPAAETEVLANVLAYTGLSTAGLLGFAGAVLVAGTVLVLSSRRRRGTAR